MNFDTFISVVNQLTPLLAIVSGLIGVLKFIGVRSRNEKMREVGADFRNVVNALASDERVKKLSAAILIRRFFDAETESGIAGTPYAKEAIGVIAAILRDENAKKDMQKILADGLGYAPSLKDEDLQQTDLSHAYLANRIRTDITIEGADLYNADLTGASLEGICAHRTVFYHAQCTGTKFAKADLTNADFREAMLEGARFDGARLEDAQFDGAKLRGARFRDVTGLSASVEAHLDENRVYSMPPE